MESFGDPGYWTLPLGTSRLDFNSHGNNSQMLHPSDASIVPCFSHQSFIDQMLRLSDGTIIRFPDFFQPSDNPSDPCETIRFSDKPSDQFLWWSSVIRCFDHQIIRWFNSTIRWFNFHMNVMDFIRWKTQWWMKDLMTEASDDWSVRWSEDPNVFPCTQHICKQVLQSYSAQNLIIWNTDLGREQGQL